MSGTSIFKIILLSSFFITLTKTQQADSSNYQTYSIYILYPDFIFGYIDKIIEYISQNMILLHQYLKISMNLEYPLDLITFIMIGFTFRFLLQLIMSKSKFVYNKSEEIDLTIINELKSRELIGLTFNDNGICPSESTLKNGEKESILFENIESNLSNISKEIKRSINMINKVSTSNQQFGDNIADSHFKLFSLIKDSQLED